MSDNKFTRRDFLKASLAGTSALVAPTIINYLGKSSPSPDKEFLEIRDGKFYLGGEEYMIKGANYQTRNYPWRMFKEYHPESIEKELDIAKELGINSLRVPLTVPYATEGSDFDFINDPEINEEYFENFDDFLGIADKHGMKVMPIMFDFVPWTTFKPENFSVGEKYLEEWVPEFVEDERILAWDIINGPDIIEFNLEESGKQGYEVNEFTREMFNLIKEIDQNHPVTIGTSDVHPFDEEELMVDLPRYIEHEDFACIHSYVGLRHFDEIFDKVKDTTDKPIVLEEFGLPTTGKDKWHTEEFQKKYYNKILEKAQRENIDGVMFWKLNDHPEELGELEIEIGAVYKNDINKPFESDFGVLRTDYSKKPAAHVVEQYYKWIL